ncbi:hypothetical protein Pyn_02123 [Prunus yedoensis var. nudiflora]|uniref:Uncharacterized protein n=1 Tax=Prunus yedoensis var. nudiflora TaxID=2094558 RepID=A0A314Z304_PRUYE|nr:hypothetical protein Pyn_02123 [Prunus yedoensis var. nudiflora]
MGPRSEGSCHRCGWLTSFRSSQGSLEAEAEGVLLVSFGALYEAHVSCFYWVDELAPIPMGPTIGLLDKKHFPTIGLLPYQFHLSIFLCMDDRVGLHLSRKFEKGPPSTIA